MPALTGINHGRLPGSGLGSQRTGHEPAGGKPAAPPSGLSLRPRELRSADTLAPRAALPPKAEKQLNDAVQNFAAQFFQSGMDEMKSSMDKLTQKEEDEDDEDTDGE